jgi:hypothetical protein
MFIKRFVDLSFALLCLAFAVQSALACSYGATDVCEQYARADLIVVGKIVSVKPSKSEQIVVVNIERTYKGPKLEQIVLNQAQSTCDPDFSDNVGETWLLYIMRWKKAKKYSVLTPGMNGRIEHMNEEVYWLNNLPMSLKRTRIAGTIELYKGTVVAPERLTDPYVFVRNVAGIKVKVFCDKNSFQLTTDKNGVYEIWDIPSGKYKVEAVLPSDLMPDLEMEKGPIDQKALRNLYDELGILKENTKFSVLFDIQPNSCAGIDFVVRKKPAPAATP